MLKRHCCKESGLLAAVFWVMFGTTACHHIVMMNSREVANQVAEWGGVEGEENGSEN